MRYIQVLHIQYVLFLQDIDKFIKDTMRKPVLGMEPGRTVEPERAVPERTKR